VVRRRHKRVDDFHDMVALNIHSFESINSSDGALCHAKDRRIQDLELV
jgi:hypothetical protein